MTDVVKTGRFLEYAPAPESTSILNLRKSYGLFIDGEFVKGRGKSFKTISPADEHVIAEIANANEKDVDVAVRAARRAYDGVWSNDGTTHPEHVCGYRLGVFIELNNTTRTAHIEYFMGGEQTGSATRQY